jgi:hypothetical protein
LYVDKKLWSCSSMANIVTQLWPKYYILVTFGSGGKNSSLFQHYVYGEKIKLKKSFDPSPPPISNLACLRTKIKKIRQRFWESFEVGLDLKYDEIDDWSFNEKASLNSAKIVLRLRISKFSSSVHYICWIICVIDKNWA